MPGMCIRDIFFFLFESSNLVFFLLSNHFNLIFIAESNSDNQYKPVLDGIQKQEKKSVLEKERNTVHSNLASVSVIEGFDSIFQSSSV